MKYISLGLALILSSHVIAAPLQTVVDYLRTTPAYVNGNVRFDHAATVHKSGNTTVKLLGNREIPFNFGENFLEIYPQHGMELKVGPVTIKVKNVRWDRGAGFKVETELPIDLFGLGASYVNGEVKKELQKLFGAKMQAASNQLRTLRAAKKLSDTKAVMDNIIKIFDTPDAPPLPPVRGEMSLVFNPDRDKVLQLGEMRVGIKQNDSIMATMGYRYKSPRFTVNSLKVSSRLGIDVNKGPQFAVNKRLVFSNLELSGQGMTLGAHLGASETLLGLLMVFEVAATRAGHPPSQSCMSCLDLIQLKPFMLVVEQDIREEIISLIRSQRAQLISYGVSAATLNAFERRATCQLNGIKCTRECNRVHISSGPNNTCKNRCEDLMSDCIQ